MLQYRGFGEIVDHPGLRIVLVKGMPSPWGQAAKTIFEIKGLDYVAAPWLPGEPNADIVAWGGEASAPIVAWANASLTSFTATSAKPSWIFMSPLRPGIEAAFVFE